MNSLSSESPKRIENGTQALLTEYDKLVEFRKAAGITQIELAEKMNISQINVSKLERRKDMHLTTLRKYVEALGGKLEIRVIMPQAPDSDSQVRA